MKDRLYLLRPGFFKGDEGPFYCGDSVAVEGLLSFFPKLRATINIEYIDFARPRKVLVDLLGEDHQSAPVLVLADGARPTNAQITTQEARGHRFISDERVIRAYLSSQYKMPVAS